MTNLEQALTYIHRELKFMATDPSGAANQHKFADKVIEDVTDIPNLCSSALASAKPLAPILNAVRGPRGNALMKFFNVSLHDTRMEMTMVVAEATRLRGTRNRKTEDAYDYLSSMYQAAVRKFRKLVHGRANAKDGYQDRFTTLQKFAGFGGAGLSEYDDLEDDDGDTEFYMGDSGYADAALEALREGRPVPPQPQSQWGMSTNYPGVPLTGNEDVLKQIHAIESQIGRPLSDSELDSFLTGERMISPTPATPEFNEQFFAELGQLQRGGTPQAQNPFATADAAKEALIQLIVSGQLNLKDIASLLQGSQNPNVSGGASSVIEEAPAVVDVDPESLKTGADPAPEISSEPAAAVPKLEAPTKEFGHDPDLAELIRARNNLAPAAAPKEKETVTEPERAPEQEHVEGGDAAQSSQKGPDSSSGPIPESNAGSGDVSGSNQVIIPKSQAGQFMDELINRVENLTHNELATIIGNIFTTAGSEVMDTFISLNSSSEPDEIFTLMVYVKAAHSSELVSEMAINNAVITYANILAQQFGLEPTQIGKAVYVTEGEGTFDVDLRNAYITRHVFWKETIRRNLQCTAIIAYFFYKQVDLNLRVDYVSDYPGPNQEKCINYVFNLYPKTEEVSFDDIRTAYNIVELEVWALLVKYFNSMEYVALVRPIEKLSMLIRIPQDCTTAKYLEDFEDLQAQTIRGNAIALIPGLQWMASQVMVKIREELVSDPAEPIEVEDITVEFNPVLAREKLDYEFIMKIYTRTKMSDERKEELNRAISYYDYASSSGEIAMLASASRVKFEVYGEVIDPSETNADPATDAVEELVNSLTQKDSAPEAAAATQPKSNAFGLPSET